MDHTAPVILLEDCSGTIHNGMILKPVDFVLTTQIHMFSKQRNANVSVRIEARMFNKGNLLRTGIISSVSLVISSNIARGSCEIISSPEITTFDKV